MDEPKTSKQQAPSASQIVWQWVCYGLWEWALLSLGILLSLTLMYYIIDDTTPENFVIYLLAAMLSLVPIAFFVDRMYAKHEPQQKSGFSGVVMVLNAVVVFLATVGGFIATVVSLLSIIVNGSSDSLTIALISSVITAVLGGLLFARIVNPEQIRRFTRFFPWIVVAVAGIAMVFAIAGPIRSLASTRNDRLVENNMYAVVSEIRSYAYEHKKLPKSLDDLTFTYSEDAQRLIDKDLVTYKPNTKPMEQKLLGQLSDYTNQLGGQSNVQTEKIFHYELCADFDRKKGAPSSTLNENAIYDIGNRHPKGETCYKLTASVY
jgi:hypothetical protein